MKIEIDLRACKHNKITPNQFTLLYLMYYREFSKIEDLFGRQLAISMRDELINTKYILSDNTTSFKETLLSNDNVCKLLEIRSDEVRFIEFFNCYPPRVQDRVLRPKDVDTVKGKQLKKKYLSKIKTKEQHKMACKATLAFVAEKRRAGNLRFLPALEVVINNASWESWEIFIQAEGTEETDWTQTRI
jgi:hypothetical protein